MSADHNHDDDWREDKDAKDKYAEIVKRLQEIQRNPALADDLRPEELIELLGTATELGVIHGTENLGKELRLVPR